MAPDSQSELPSVSPALEAQVRECYGRVVYTHKAHEKTADILLKRMSWVKTAQIVLSAMTTGGIFGVVLSQGRPLAIVTAGLATILLALNAYTKESDPGQIAQKHKEVAAKLWGVRESYLSILTDICSGTQSADDVRKRRDELQQELTTVYETAPRTLDSAYTSAGLALKQKEELTFSEAEIDKFLPEPLRSTKRVR